MKRADWLGGPDWLGGRRTRLSSSTRRRSTRRSLHWSGYRRRSIFGGSFEPLEPRRVLASLMVNSWFDSAMAGDGYVDPWNELGRGSGFPA